jgi:hypothetical protein
MEINANEVVIIEPTMNLRIVQDYSRKNVLQQQWVNKINGKTEWRDVETVIEE